MSSSVSAAMNDVGAANARLRKRGAARGDDDRACFPFIIISFQSQ